MSDQIKYLFSVDSYVCIANPSPGFAKITKIMNNEYDKQKKKDRTYFRHTVSLDALGEVGPSDMADPADSIITELIKKEEREYIQKAIGELPQKQREIIIFHFYLDLSLRQIARNKGLNEKTIRERYHQALRTLHRKLELICS